MPDPTSTFVAVVLDRSGSMEGMRDAAIQGFNELVADQQSQPGSATLSLAQFDDRYEIVHEALPIASVPLLSRATFVPRSHTALLDAIGRTLNEVEARIECIAPDARPGRVVVVVITDGKENASQEFDDSRVAAMIRAFHERPGWQVLFLGTDSISVEHARRMGVHPDDSLVFAATDVGMRSAFVAIGDSLRACRAGGTATLARARRRMN